MSKFHVNPETGNPNRCYAIKKCRFGSDSEHYATKSLAAQAYEGSQEMSSVLISHKASSADLVSNSVSKPKDTLSKLNPIIESAKLAPIKSIHESPQPLTMTEEQLAEYDEKFKNLKESSLTVMEVFKSPVKIENDFSSTTLNHKGGRALVTLAEHPVDYLNGDYLAGDLTQDPELFTKLIKQDPELEFINGDCADLAYDLYDAYPEHVVSVSQIWVKSDVDSMHSIAQLKDGSFIDGLGHWSPSGVLSVWKGLISKEVEMRTIDRPDVLMSGKTALFESSKFIGEYLDKVYS